MRTHVLILGLLVVGASNVSSQTRISDGDPGAFVQFRPQVVAVDDGGAPLYHVIWEDHRDKRWSIRHQLVDASGQPLGPSLDVAAEIALPPGDSTDPDIATNGTDVAIAFRSSGGVGERVAVLFLDGVTGQPGFGAVVTDVRTEFVGRPSVDLDPGAKIAYVAWTQSDGTWDQLYLAQFDPIVCGSPTTAALTQGVLGHHEDARVVYETDGRVRVASSFQFRPGLRRLQIHAVPVGTCLVDAVSMTSEFVDLDHTPNDVADEMIEYELLAFENGADDATLAVWIDWEKDLSPADADGKSHLRSSWSINGGAFVGEIDVGSAGDSIHAGLSLALSSSGTTSTVVAASARIATGLDLLGVPGVVEVDADRFTLDFAQPSSSGWDATSTNVSQSLCAALPCPVWPDKGGAPPLPRPVVASDGNGDVVAVWMQPQKGNQSYDYLGWSRLAAGGSTWTTVALTTPGGPSTPPGVEGTARTGYPQAVHLGNEVLFVWDDRRNWTQPPPAPTPPVLGPTDRGAPDIYAQLVPLP